MSTEATATPGTKCAFCHKPIGSLETPRRVQGRLLHEGCYQTLKERKREKDRQAAEQSRPVETPRVVEAAAVEPMPEARGITVIERPAAAPPALPQIQPTYAPPMMPMPMPMMPMVHVTTVVNNVVAAPAYSKGVAAVLSFIIPGLGQLYAGRPISGLLWFFATGFGYVCFILPGLVLHVLCVICAAV